MRLVHYTIFIVFPILSHSFTCHYNDSSTVSRNTVLIELEHQNYIHIHDATFDIKLKNETINFEVIPGSNLRLIDNIQFRGNIVQYGVNIYIEATLNSLMGYRYRKYRKLCRVSFQESKDINSILTTKQEAAITRLAESCIQSKICDNDLMELDRDSDLYYQSIQSTINEVVDFYVPKLLDFFLEHDNSFKVPTVDIKSGNVKFYAKDVIITGLDTVQRTNDVFVKPENSEKFVVDIGLRFPTLKIALNRMSAKYKRVGIYGNTIIEIDGISLKANVALDLQQDSCFVHMNNIRQLAFKRITVYIPLWGFHLYSYNFNFQKLAKWDRMILNYVTANIPEVNIDCKKYMDQLSIAL